MMSISFNNWNICLKFLRELIDIYIYIYGIYGIWWIEHYSPRTDCYELYI